jgi:uncharacterized protein (TIGR02611 family)
LGFLSDQREKQIRKLADSHLEEGEAILVWARARQPRTRPTAFQRSGFAYVTPKKFLVRWSGQSDDNPEISWDNITAWGVSEAAPGGPILGIEADGAVVYVQLPARSRLTAEGTTELLRAFAKRVPEARTELSEHPRHGRFEPRGDVSISPIRRSLAGHTKRLVITIVGTILIVLAVLIIPLPGPWSILLTILGLALLANEYDWAEDALHWMREKYRWTREKLRERRARGDR